MTSYTSGRMAFRMGRRWMWIVAAAAVIVAGGALAYFLTTRSTTASAGLPGDDVVRARVGSTTISEYDVKLGIEKNVPKGARPPAQAITATQMLESLIQARAIALAREAEMTPVQRLELDKIVARHREELLVKQYLIEHGNVEGMKTDELRKYYESHKAEFGGAPSRTYEMVGAETRLAGSDRDDVIRELGKAKATTDWFEWVKKLREQGKGVVHYRGDLAASIMNAQLATVAEKLKPGEVSEVTMIDGRPHVIRLVSEGKGAVKPFESVAGEIRERLAPVVLSRAAKAAAAEAMKKVEVKRY